MPTFNSCTKSVGTQGHNIRLHARLPPIFLGMDDLIPGRSFDSQAKWVIDVLRLYSDMLSMGVCITRNWHTSGQRVQELNVCTCTVEMSHLLGIEVTIP